ncbi:MAG: hypothetical protein AAFV95_01635 [Bacteroidota bacterium]
MRYTMRCPKCDSDRVVEVVGSNMNQHQKIPLTTWSFKHATLDRYICADCGYTEEFVQLTNGFQRWAERQLQRQPRKPDDFV